MIFLEYMALCQFKGSFIVVYCGEPLYSTFFVTYATIGQGSKHLRLFWLSCYFFLGFLECFGRVVLWHKIVAGFGGNFVINVILWLQQVAYTSLCKILDQFQSNLYCLVHFYRLKCNMLPWEKYLCWVGSQTPIEILAKVIPSCSNLCLIGWFQG